MFFVVQALGPIIGFSLGSYAMHFDVNWIPGKQNSSDLSTETEYSGCWWMFFPLFSCVTLVVSQTFWFFPRRLDLRVIKSRSQCHSNGSKGEFSLSKEIGKIGATAAVSGTVGSSKTHSKNNLMEEISLAFDFRTRNFVKQTQLYFIFEKINLEK